MANPIPDPLLARILDRARAQGALRSWLVIRPREVRRYVVVFGDGDSETWTAGQVWAFGRGRRVTADHVRIGGRLVAVHA